MARVSTVVDVMAAVDLILPTNPDGSLECVGSALMILEGGGDYVWRPDRILAPNGFIPIK